MTYKNSCHENVIFFFTGKKENPLAVWPQTLGQIPKYNGHKNSQSWWNLWTLVTSNGIVDIDGSIHFLYQIYLDFHLFSLARFSTQFGFFFSAQHLSCYRFSISGHFNELEPKAFRFILFQHILCFGPYASQKFFLKSFPKIQWKTRKQKGFFEPKENRTVAATHSRIKTTQSKCRVNSLQSECRFSPYIFQKKGRSISIRKIKTVFSFRVRVTEQLL